MGKTIIIPGADFSAVAVEQIDVPQEINDVTLAWISASGNTLTDAQQTALNNLVIALGANNNSGIWTKIDKLFLPMLAADKAHALLDYKLATPAAPTLDTDSQASWDDNIEFVNHGLKSTIESGTVAVPIIVDATYTIDTQNFSLFFLNSEAYGTVSSSTGRGGLGCPSTLNKSFFKTQTGAGAVLYFAMDTSEIGRESTLTPSLTGVIGTSDACTVIMPTTTGTKEAKTQETLTGLAVMNMNAANRLVYNTDAAKGAFIAGKAMTVAEAQTLQSVVNALFAAINA